MVWLDHLSMYYTRGYVLVIMIAQVGLHGIECLWGDLSWKIDNPFWPILKGPDAGWLIKVRCAATWRPTGHSLVAYWRHRSVPSGGSAGWNSTMQPIGTTQTNFRLPWADLAAALGSIRVWGLWGCSDFIHQPMKLVNILPVAFLILEDGLVP
jgi:hypothetical protein